MKRLFRGFSSSRNQTKDLVKNSFILPESGWGQHPKEEERFPRSFYEKGQDSSATRNVNSCTEKGLLTTSTGYHVIRSSLVNNKGWKLGDKHYHQFVITPYGKVLMEEIDGERVYPDLKQVLGATEAKRLETEIESTRCALNLAFKKKSRGEARVERQSHRLASLEEELRQVMKDIKRTSHHLEIISQNTNKSRAQLATLLQHEMSKIEVQLRLEEPQILEEYDGLKTSQQTVDFKKFIRRRIHNLEKLLALAKHKHTVQKKEEKESGDVPIPPEPKPKRKVKRKKTMREKVKEERENLMLSMLQVADARRRGDIRQILETEL